VKIGWLTKVKQHLQICQHFKLKKRDRFQSAARPEEPKQGLGSWGGPSAPAKKYEGAL